MAATVNVAVRALTPAEIGLSARLHGEALDMEFLARCGQGFLRAYHRAWLDSPTGLALAAVDDDHRILGVLLGSVDPASHYRSMVRRHGASLAGRLLVSALMRPALARDLIVTRARRYGRGLLRMLAGWVRDDRMSGKRDRGDAPHRPPSSAVADSADRSDPAATGEVTHVMVRSDARRGGVGRVLLARAEEEARLAGLDELVLVTPPDLAATSFYEHLGWQRVGELTSQSGEQFLRYRFDLRL